VNLNGSNTSDPTPTGTLAFHWTQIAGTTVTLVNPSSSHPTFTAPFVAVGGEILTFQLDVSDGEFAAADIVNITIVNVNHTPVADAGLDQTVQETAPVMLHGENSFDADGDPIHFAWVQIAGPPVTLSDPQSTNPTFSAPALAGGDPETRVTLTFQLTVDDLYAKDRPADGFTFASVSDTVDVTISNLDQGPSADAGPDQTVTQGSAVLLQAGASSDPDGDPLRFSWAQQSGPEVTLLNPESANATFIAPINQSPGTTLTFVLTVDDGFDRIATDEVVISLQAMNAPPDVTNARPTVALLWPPNHKLVLVEIVGVSDDEGAPAVAISGVTQDEPTNGTGDGDIGPDAVISGNKAFLRAERAGAGDGRAYRISFSATDSHGSRVTGSVRVLVPQNAKSLSVDSGQRFDSTVP
jgi:hypothetical protein